MFSKFIKFILLLGSLGLFSCNLKTGEEPPPQSLGQLSATACISDASESLRKFALGDAKDQEVGASFDCLHTAIQKFSKYVRGRDEQKFDIRELAEFVENYFITKDASGLPLNRISSGLQTELMRIKQLFFGGSLQYVTRAELASISQLLLQLKGMAVQVNPYMKVYTLNWKISNDRTEDSKYFEGANQQLQVFAKDLSTLMTSDHEPYEFKNFLDFLTQSSGFYNEQWAFISDINRYLPLVYKVKKIIAGGSEESISPGQWKSFLLLGARSYVQYNRYYYFLSHPIDSTSSISLSYITRELEDLFSVFEDLVREKPTSETRRDGRHPGRGHISRAELDELLKALSEVWPKFKISEALVDEAMVVKQVLFGGHPNDWSSDDFANAKNKVSQLRPLLENFFPYFSIYSLAWNPERLDDVKAQAYFKQAQDSLSEVMLQFGGLLEAPYTLSHLYHLVNEFEKLYPAQVDSENLDDSLKKYLPLFQNIKNMLFEDQGDRIDQKNWPKFLSFNSDLYSFYLNYHYFIRGRSLKEPRALFAMRFLVESSMDGLEKLMKIKSSHVISDRELLALSEELQKINVIYPELKKNTLSKLITASLQSVFNPPERRLNGIFPNNFDRESLETLRNEAYIWIETEFFVRNIFLGPSSEITFSPFELQQKIDERLSDPTLSMTLKLGLLELKRVLSSPIPLIVDSEMRLAISGRLRPDYTSDSVSRLNATRAVSRILMRAYGTPPKSIPGEFDRLSKDQALKAFNELKWPALDLKYLAPENTSFVDSRFLEGNIFGPQGNGDNFIGFLELSDLLNMILSGTTLDSLIRPELMTQCLPSVLNPETSTQLDYDCLYKVYRKNLSVIFTSVPDFLKFTQENDSCEDEIVFFNLIKAAGYTPNAQKRVKLGEVALIPHVIQYLEMTFSRFDANHDDRLDRIEAEKAFPVFQPLFKDLAKDYIKKGLISEKDLFPLFTFVLKTGKIPSGPVDFIKFFVWKNTAPERRNFTSDRNKLASILGVVADQSAPKPGKAAAAPSADTMAEHISKQCRPATEVSVTPIPGHSPILIGRARH